MEQEKRLNAITVYVTPLIFLDVVIGDFWDCILLNSALNKRRPTTLHTFGLFQNKITLPVLE